MKKIIHILIAITFIVIPVYAKEGKNLVPSPVPVNIKPADYDQSYWGFGYNYLEITSEWEDDFVIGATEHIGEIKYKVHNLTLARLKGKSGRSIVEYDFLLGIVKGESVTDRYYSDKFSREFDVELSSSGYDAGVRILFSQSLFDNNREDNFIEWNYAFSLHAALFYLENEASGFSVDGQYGEEYYEEEWGIFLRPVIALQPIINLSRMISIIPYVGIGTKVTASSYYWENTGDYIWMGTSQPGQKTDGAGSTTSFAGIEGIIGADIGIITSKENNHSLTIGGLFSKFFTGNDSKFYEFHAVYSIPFN